MPRQTVEIVKLVGKKNVVAVRKKLTSGDETVIKTFISNLRSNCTEPPMLFYQKHADTWSMFGDFELNFGDPLKAEVSHLTVYCYENFHNASALVNRFRRSAKGEKGIGGVERRKFRDAIVEAFDAWPKDMCSALLVIREVVGVVLDDSEVIEKLKVTPSWLMN